MSKMIVNFPKLHMTYRTFSAERNFEFSSSFSIYPPNARWAPLREKRATPGPYRWKYPKRRFQIFYTFLNSQRGRPLLANSIRPANKYSLFNQADRTSFLKNNVALTIELKDFSSSSGFNIQSAIDGSTTLHLSSISRHLLMIFKCCLLPKILSVNFWLFSNFCRNNILFSFLITSTSSRDK